MTETAPDAPELLVAHDGPVARLTFNRPHVRNALTPGMLAGTTAFFERAADDPAIRCLVLAGAGEHFMAGGDVGGFATQLALDGAAREAEFSRRAEGAFPVFRAMAACAKPIIAKVRGAAAGASLSWVAAADFVLASDTAQFVFAHVPLGLSPDAGLTHYLPRAVGWRRATELILLGARIDGQRAAEIGLATRMIDDAALDAATEELADKLCSLPAAAVASSKRLLADAARADLETQLRAEARAFGACAAGDDFARAVAAFIGKRKPG